MKQSMGNIVMEQTAVMEQENLLLQNLDQLHTTVMGVERIRRNLQISEEDVVAWCRKLIASPQAVIQRRGKTGMC